MVIEPHEIKFSDFKEIIKSSFQLMTRKFVAFFVFTAIAFFAHQAAYEVTSFLSSIISVIALNIGMLIAKGADESKSSLILISAVNPIGIIKAAMPTLVLLFSVISLITIIVVFFLYLNQDSVVNIDQPNNSGKHNIGLFYSFGSGFIMNSTIQCGILMGTSMLSMNYNAPLKTCVLLSINALRKNPILINFFVLPLHFIGNLLSMFDPLCFIFAPLYSCVSYVVFRAVFIGGTKNMERKTSPSLISLLASRKPVSA